MIALVDAIAGMLMSWHGLAGTETVEAVLEALGPFSKVYEAVDSERQQQRFRLIVVEREVPPHRIELWTLHGERTITLLEYDDPLLQDVEAVLKVYGDPDILLEDKRTAQGAVVREYVYASRGLTLSVAEPYPGSKQKSREVVHVQLYRSGSANYYWRYIGPGFELRPTPRSSAR
jgi:hypothetical protein